MLLLLFTKQQLFLQNYGNQNASSAGNAVAGAEKKWCSLRPDQPRSRDVKAVTTTINDSFIANLLHRQLHRQRPSVYTTRDDSSDES